MGFVCFVFVIFCLLVLKILSSIYSVFQSVKVLFPHQTSCLPVIRQFFHCLRCHLNLISRLTIMPVYLNMHFLQVFSYDAIKCYMLARWNNIQWILRGYICLEVNLVSGKEIVTIKLQIASYTKFTDSIAI